jgi:hypothetical protein
MGFSSQTLNQSFVVVQDTRPTNPPDGLIWVNSSLDERPAEAYSAATDSWGPVGINEYSQLSNIPVDTGVDSYVSGTLAQNSLTRGITNYASDSGSKSSGSYNRRTGTFGGVYDFPAGYESAYVDMVDYTLDVSVSDNHPECRADVTLTGEFGSESVSHSTTLGDGTKTFNVSETFNFTPTPLNELTVSKWDLYIYYDLGDSSNGGDYSVSFTFNSDVNVTTNIPHNHKMP